MTDLRRTGRTTRQIQAAKIDAVYIAPTRAAVQYTENLARFLGRGDLHIVHREWLHSDKWRGITMNAVVLDHAIELNQREWDLLGEVQWRVVAHRA